MSAKFAILSGLRMKYHKGKIMYKTILCFLSVVSVMSCRTSSQANLKEARDYELEAVKLHFDNSSNKIGEAKSRMVELKALECSRRDASSLKTPYQGKYILKFGKKRGKNLTVQTLFVEHLPYANRLIKDFGEFNCHFSDDSDLVCNFSTVWNKEGKLILRYLKGWEGFSSKFIGREVRGKKTLSYLSCLEDQVFAADQPRGSDISPERSKRYLKQLLKYEADRERCFLSSFAARTEFDIVLEACGLKDGFYSQHQKERILSLIKAYKAFMISAGLPETKYEEYVRKTKALEIDD